MSCDACPSCFINPSVATSSTPGKAGRCVAIDDGRGVVMNADASWAARHDDATTTIASFITMIAGTRYSTFLVLVCSIARSVCQRD